MSTGCNDFIEKDKVNVIGNAKDFNLSVAAFSNANLVRPNIGRELKDKFLGSNIHIRLVAFKTNASLDRSVAMPSRMYFTTKFYSFNEVRTQDAVLTHPGKDTKSSRIEGGQ